MVSTLFWKTFTFLHGKIIPYFEQQPTGIGGGFNYFLVFFSRWNLGEMMKSFDDFLNRVGKTTKLWIHLYSLQKKWGTCKSTRFEQPTINFQFLHLGTF